MDKKDNTNKHEAQNTQKKEAQPNMKKKETQQRVIEIKDFKNIGVSQMDSEYNLSDKIEELLLNTSYLGDLHGGLVTIIGENNTGKSNVNKAMAKFMFDWNTAFSANDIPNYIDYDDCEPALKFSLRDYTAANSGGAKYIATTLASIMQGNEEVTLQFCNEKAALKAAIRFYADRLKENVNYNRTEIENIVFEAGRENDVKKLMNLFIKLKNMENSKLKDEYNAKIAKYGKDKAEPDAQYQQELNEAHNELKDSTRSVVKTINEYEQSYRIFYYARQTRNEQENKKLWQELQDSIFNAKDYDGVVEGYKKLQNFITEVIQDYNQNRGHYYGGRIEIPTFLTPKKVVKEESSESIVVKIIEEVFDGYVDTIEINNKKDIALPTIINYNNNRRFINSDLIAKPEKIEKSHFFNALFHAMPKKMSGILNVYEKAKSTTRGYLTREQEAINECVAKTITKRFNNLYGKVGKESYRFDIKLDKDEISLSLFKGDDVVVLDDQSSGFKWFFNLYFNLLNGRILKSGDIVLMDEPAHNLSPKARKECVQFLRKYGEENGITFVVVTHDLFWIDSDFLNEVRIIKERKDEALKGVCIQNDFSRIESSDSDTFLEIKRAFGVDAHVFYPPNVRKVYVEGITDYNYLTTFKLLKEKESGTKLDIVFIPICGLGANNKEREKVLENLMKQDNAPTLLIDSDGVSAEIEKLKNGKKYQSLTIVKLGDIDSKFKAIESLFDKNDIEKYGLEVKSSGISSAFKKHILWAKEDENEEKLSKQTKEDFYKALTYLLENV